MGIAAEYRCEDCGHQFGASKDFSFGFLGEVVTPVVCVEHGLGGAETGINVARGDKITSADRAKTEYPCPRCAVPSPRWDRRSCPKCGGSRLDWLGQILWD